MSTEHYSAHQKSLGRPISPHVTIYTMPATAKSSITNRFAAMGMSTAFAAGSAVAFVGGDIPALIYAAQDLIPGFATASKLLVAFPISYHLLSAARAVTFARMPQLINNADGPKSTYALYGASAVITLAAGAYTIKAPEDEVAATEA
ncbi:hypothetical protein BBJ28_00010690 [Nothophytophthora sp. Chile5]|nr:hypothetical protein BBJ28_00010690 [Nothophytophthora sp. Chile5]